MQMMVPPQGLRWGRTQPGRDKDSLPGLRDLPPGPSLPSAHSSGQPEESLMSSTPRSHQSLPAAGLGTGRWQEDDSWSPLPRKGFPSFPPGWKAPTLAGVCSESLAAPSPACPAFAGGFKYMVPGAVVPEPCEQDRSRDGHQVQPRVQLTRQVHGHEAGLRSRWEVNPEVRTRSSEGNQVKTQSSGHQASAEQ